MQDIGFWNNTWNKLFYGWDLNQIGDTLLIGPDTSHWSMSYPPENYFDEEKFAKQVEEKEVKTIVYKGTDSNKTTGRLFTDRTAKFWHYVGGKFKLLRGSYHWLQYSVDPKVAFEYHNELEKECPTELPYIVDFEEPSVTNYSDYLWRARVWLDLANTELVDDVSLIYSGIGYLRKVRAAIAISQLEDKMGWMRENNLWIALYSRRSPANYLKWAKLGEDGMFPWKPDDWVKWQYSFAADFPYYVDKDALNGRQWGITSLGLDMNYVKRTWLQKYIDKYFGNGNNEEPEEPTEEPEEPEEPADVKGLLFKSKHLMNIRSKPGTTYSIIGQLPENTIVVATDIGGNNCWIKTELGWICKNLNGRNYLDLEE